MYNHINVGSGVQAESLVVAKLLIVVVNEEWFLNIEIVVFVRSNQVKAWLNRKEVVAETLDLFGIGWNMIEADLKAFVLQQRRIHQEVLCDYGRIS